MSLARRTERALQPGDDESPIVFAVDDDSAGLKAQTFASAQEFLTSRRPKAPSCLVRDVQLPGSSGLDLQQELVKVGAQLPIVFNTGHGDIPTTVRAVKAGAIEFLTKPFRDEHLLTAVEQAIHRSLQIGQPGNTPADDKPGGSEGRRRASFPEIVGRSAALGRLLRAIETLAPTDSTVLIHGEMGTGKELVACAIHNASRRCSSPFMRLNCAAIPAHLHQSELFGHERDAFTGAVVCHIGRFEFAQRLTVFLDEIGDLPLDLQPDPGGRTRAGRHQPRFEGGGRGGRLPPGSVLPAECRADRAAPLRERREDIPVLVEYLVERYVKKTTKRIVAIDPGTMELLQAYDWPGNIRELQNVTVVLSDGETLSVDAAWLTQEISFDPPQPSPSERKVGRVAPERESEIIEAALAESRGRISGPTTGAAAKLGTPRQMLESRITRRHQQVSLPGGVALCGRPIHDVKARRRRTVRLVAIPSSSRPTARMPHLLGDPSGVVAGQFIITSHLGLETQGRAHREGGADGRARIFDPLRREEHVQRLRSTGMDTAFDRTGCETSSRSFAPAAGGGGFPAFAS
jgi:DNA-binding NtrC family response regulator